MIKLRVFPVLLLILIQASQLFSQDRKVSLTFDDLPATMGDYEYITNQIVETLVRNQVSAIGFVNEGKLYEENNINPKRVDLLRKWLDAGFDLGNHTYSHVFIDRVAADEYKEEILKGELVTRPLLREYGKDLIYFRHTQLRTGPTHQYRRELNEFLSGRGYTVAPVTIDHDEYIYAYCYEKAFQENDEERLQFIRTDYIRYMEEVFDYYEKLSVDFLGYELPQTLLLHANRLNADTLSDLLKMMESRGYQFISLEESLADEAYQLPEAVSQRGLSWIHRWMIADGLEPDPQPSVSSEIQTLFEFYQADS